MPTYTICFTGRKHTEHGIFYPVTTTDAAENPRAALLAALDEYELLGGLTINGVPGWPEEKE